MPAYLQSELNAFDLRKVRRRVWRFKQQEVTHKMFLSSSFRRYNGTRLIAGLGIATILLGEYTTFVCRAKLESMCMRIQAFVLAT